MLEQPRDEGDNLDDELARLRARHLQRQEYARLPTGSALAGVLTGFTKLFQEITRMAVLGVLLLGVVLGGLLTCKLLIKAFAEWWPKI